MRVVSAVHLQLRQFLNRLSLALLNRYILAVIIPIIPVQEAVCSKKNWRRLRHTLIRSAVSTYGFMYICVFYFVKTCPLIFVIVR